MFTFIMSCSISNSQERINTEHLRDLLTNSLYNGHVIVNEHLRGKLYERFSNHLKNEDFEISNINFHQNSRGDFNKNGKPDIFATMQIRKRSRNEIYLCLVEVDNDIATIYSYFEMGLYSQVKITDVKNDTLKVKTQMWGRNKESYLDRMASLVHDEQNSLRIVTPNKLDNMKDTSIFKSDFQNIKRESFISNQVIRKQNEEYHNEDLSISAELSGFNDLTLRYTITKEI